MLNRIGLILVSLILLTGVIAGCQPASTTGGTGNRVGNFAPDFALKDLSGQTVSLSSYLGRGVILNFWALDCPYCLDEMPFLETARRNEAAREDRVEILTVNMKDSAAAISAYFNGQGYGLNAVLDSGARLSQTYGVSGIPATFMIDSQGVIVHIKRGAFISLKELELNLNRARE